VVCKVVQPASAAPAASKASARIGAKRKEVAMRKVVGKEGERRVRW
jgi:hypothetical protein